MLIFCDRMKRTVIKNIHKILIYNKLYTIFTKNSNQKPLMTFMTMTFVTTNIFPYSYNFSLFPFHFSLKICNFNPDIPEGCV